jgi:cellulose synthase/poly-beta-1,6-N-acetylglucosamine synthase-like glycosyltransferase
VIPAYNERDLVGHAIRSVQAQTVTDWEVIVVDDGSSDGTADAVRPFTEGDERIRLVSKENEGLSAARNTGIELARAPLVSFLDSDDMWLPDYLEAMGSALEAAPSAGWAYTDAWALDVDSGRFRRATAMASCQPPAVLPEDTVEVMKLLIRQNFMWVSATVRRDALVAAGMFDAEMKSAEDIELWFRVLALGYSVVRPPGVLGIKRERLEAMSRQDLKNVINLQVVMSRVAADERVPPEVRQLATKRIDGLERWRLALSGESRLLALGLRARLLLGRLKRATVGRQDWLAEPPAEVQAAFPDLAGR